jgi:hypothetical protein
MPEMSVIIVNWNGKHFLDTCLSALRRQTFQDFETILVDNGSEDQSAEFVRAHFPEVRLIVLNQNLGFTGGNIVGWEQSRGDVVVLLNNDTEADPHWLEEIDKGRREYPSAGAFACKMLYFDDRHKIDNCGFGLFAIGCTVDLGRGERDGTAAWATPRKVFGASGGAAAYRRSMLDDVGFLDPAFFMTYEDVDLSFRAQLRGYECVFLPAAVVYHRYRATMVKYPARQAFFSQRNIEIVYLKNMPLGLMLRSLPQKILYEIGGALYFIKMGVGGAFLKAKLDVLRQFPSIMRQRKGLQKSKVLSDAELRSIMQGNWLAVKARRFSGAWLRPPAISARNSKLGP